MEISSGCTIHGFNQYFASRIVEASYGFLPRDKTDSNDIFRRFLEKVRGNAPATQPSKLAAGAQEADSRRGRESTCKPGYRDASSWTCPRSASRHPPETVPALLSSVAGKPTCDGTVSQSIARLSGQARRVRLVAPSRFLSPNLVPTIVCLLMFSWTGSLKFRTVMSRSATPCNLSYSGEDSA